MMEYQSIGSILWRKIGTAQVRSLDTAWQGQIQSGQHQWKVDEPEKLGGQDAGPAPY